MSNILGVKKKVGVTFVGSFASLLVIFKDLLFSSLRCDLVLIFDSYRLALKRKRLVLRRKDKLLISAIDLVKPPPR